LVGTTASLRRTGQRLTLRPILVLSRQKRLMHGINVLFLLSG
jgi:hypothetical protein